jgi:hypothetical protein
MATKVSPPPLPPPASTADEERGGQESFFLQKFIAQNSQTDPSKSKQMLYTNAYLQTQCLVPLTTPEQALPDVKPMISLSESDLYNDMNQQQQQQQQQGESRTALQDFRNSIARCANYKQTSEINTKIFQFKTRRWKLKHMLKSATDAHQKDLIETQLAQLEEPPYHEEYSDLKVMQNYTLAGIHKANHRICLSHSACPKLTKQLLQCYRAMDPNVGQALAKQGLGNLICMEEREAVERCVGNGVQRVVKEILN